MCLEGEEEVAFALPGFDGGRVSDYRPGTETMIGSELKLGFLYLYNLFTGGTKVKILSNDDSHSIATLLLQLMGDKNDRGFLPSILNILSHNPDLCQRLPKVRSFSKNSFVIN